MPSPSRSVLRNRQIRQALADTFCGQRFTVRNGRHGMVAVTWEDGPTSGQVARLIRSIPDDSGSSHWAYSVSREITPALLAVGFLRAAAVGRAFYEEFDNTDKRSGSLTARWSCVDDHVDAATITADERGQSLLVLSLAADDRTWNPHQPARAVARTVHLHYRVVLAVTAA